MMWALVLSYCIILNYGDKKARNLGLTCRCYVTNIMLSSIFYDIMRWEKFTFLGRVIITVFFSTKEVGLVLSL